MSSSGAVSKVKAARSVETDGDSSADDGVACKVDSATRRREFGSFLTEHERCGGESDRAVAYSSVANNLDQSTMDVVEGAHRRGRCNGDSEGSHGAGVEGCGQ